MLSTPMSHVPTMVRPSAETSLATVLTGIGAPGSMIGRSSATMPVASVQRNACDPLLPTRRATPGSALWSKV